MKAIIFGANSQDGHYLTEICMQRGIAVIGVSRSTGNWITGDVSNQEFVFNLIENHKPDFIFHLAANSTTKHEAILENFSTIVTGTMNILEAVRLHSNSCRVFIAGSGLQFVNTGKPIKETDPLQFNTAYALTRNQSILAARYYRTIGLQVYIGYLFHHESPLRKANHLSKYTSDIIRKIDKTNEAIPISIGDVTVKKEWGYAEDICEGIFTLVNQDKIFEATIGTGIGYTIKEWLETCFTNINRNWNDYVVDKGKTFVSEYPILISNNSTIESLGWRPKTGLNKLAEIMLK